MEPLGFQEVNQRAEAGIEAIVNRAQENRHQKTKNQCNDGEASGLLFGGPCDLAELRETVFEIVGDDLVHRVHS